MDEVNVEVVLPLVDNNHWYKLDEVILVATMFVVVAGNNYYYYALDVVIHVVMMFVVLADNKN